MSSLAIKVLIRVIQCDRVGNEAEFIFKFNRSNGKRSVILHDLPSGVH